MARLKRQTGGHGQFADVKIDIAPRERGEGFQFIDKVVGGAVPRNFIPAVGDAARGSHAAKARSAIRWWTSSVTLVDGGFHSVDSSDMAFKTATQIAMKEGLAKADPVLLEPIDHVTISVPNDYTARAQRLLTGRRGQILGFAERPGWAGWDDVEALVPEAETARPDHRTAVPDDGPGHVPKTVRSPGGDRGRSSDALRGMMPPIMLRETSD